MPNSSAACARVAWTSRDFPMPGSPDMRTTERPPARAVAQASRSSPRSAVRPTSGESPRRARCSKRARVSTGRMTRYSASGLETPLSTWSPSATRSNWPSTSSLVEAEITHESGSHAVCTRAAMFERVAPRDRAAARVGALAADDRVPGVDPDAHRQRVAALGTHPRGNDRLHELVAAADRPDRVVLGGERIAEQHGDPVAGPVGHVAVGARDHLVADAGVAAHHGAEVFRVERHGERGGGDQIAEEDGQQPALGRIRVGCRTSAHEHAIAVVGEAQDVDELLADDVERGLVELQLERQGAPGNASTPLEHGDRFVDGSPELRHCANLRAGERRHNLRGRVGSAGRSWPGRGARNALNAIGRTRP